VNPPEGGIDSAWISRPPEGTESLARRFQAVAMRFPDRQAIADLDRTLDYGALSDRVAVTGAELLDAAPRPGPALLMVTRPIEAAIGFLAATSVGRAVVPLDPALDARSVQTLVERVDATAVLQAESRAAGPGLRVLRPIEAGSRREGQRDAAAATSDIMWSPVVRITNTSGSTGAPRLVADHAAVIHGRVLPDLDAPRRQERIASNVSAAGGFLTRMVQALLSGDLFVGFALGDRTPSETLRRLAAARVSRLTVTPSVLRRLASARRHPDATATAIALPTVQEVWTIGEALLWSDVADARALCGTHVRVRNSYGSTEAGIIAEHEVGPDEAIGTGPVAVGRPVAGRRIWIADEGGREVTDGSVGRIVVEGRFTTQGIPFERITDDVCRFVSSDLGRIDDRGVLHHLGRDDDTVKVAGMRVELAAIETVIRSLPGVLDVAVVAVALAPGEVRLVAHVVRDPSHPVEAEELRLGTKGAVTGVAVPARFVVHDSPLPLLASGKIDRVKLAALR
jgi:acyl-coenzyme A synthetase/AMP-(fatty) acid ligase